MTAHQILEVSPTASKEEIEKSYRRLARQHHPDRNPGDAEAEKKFKEIQAAYDQVTKPQSKQSGFNPFDMFFGSGFQDMFTVEKRGRNYEVRLDLTVEEFAFGFEKEVTVTEQLYCKTCQGSGGEANTGTPCDKCHGQGKIVFKSGFSTVSTTCQYCDGKGTVYNKKCQDCNGKGAKKSQRVEKVSHKGNILPGKTVVLRSKGEAVPEGIPGELLVRTRVIPHPIYSWADEHLAMSLDVPFHLFYTGGEVTAATLRGERKVTIEPNSPLKKEVVFTGEGIEGFDFIVSLNPVMPEKSEKMDEIFKQF